MTITINGTTGIAGVDGSASTPAVQGADTNTGVFFGTDTVTISTGGTAAVTVDSGQRTKFPTTIGVGGATPATSGSGISFPATASASSDANTLDDYEEGTWTVTATCGTSGTITLSSSFNTGKYTLVGNTVFFNAHLRVSAISSPVGILTFSLPFTIASGANQNRAAGTVWAYDITATAGDSVVLQLIENTAGLRFATQNAADTYFIDTVTAGIIKTTTEMSITGFFYRA
jgi:hypothetical protein